MIAGRTSTITVRTPAKINLQLAVGAAREDGYHEVVSVYHAVSLYDDLTVAAAADFSLEVTGERCEDVPTDASNLAVRAARLLAERAGVTEGAAMTLHKGIPVSGGMAGGSADAAAALVACDTLWRTGLPREELLELAGELGADVPFALVGGTAVGTGRGERLTPALARGDYHWVFALSEDGLSTPAVYREYDRLTAGRALPEPRVAEQLMQALRSGDAVALGRAMRNDLEAAACSLDTRLGLVLEVGMEYGALGGLVSGSGPTVGFLVADAEKALDLAVALTASGTCRTVKRAHGPVHGARVVELPHLH